MSIFLFEVITGGYIVQKFILLIGETFLFLVCFLLSSLVPSNIIVCESVLVPCSLICFYNNRMLLCQAHYAEK